MSNLANPAVTFTATIIVSNVMSPAVEDDIAANLKRFRGKRTLPVRIHACHRINQFKSALTGFLAPCYERETFSATSSATTVSIRNNGFDCGFSLGQGRMKYSEGNIRSLISSICFILSRIKCAHMWCAFMNNEFRRNESFRKLCIIAIRSLCFRMKTRIRFSNKILIKYLSIIHDISLNS